MSAAIQNIDIRHLHAVRELAARSFARLWAPGDFAYFLAHDCRQAFGVFDEQQNLRAYFLALLVQGELDIISVATQPEHRRQGLGSLLLRHSLAQSGVEKAFLEVAVENHAAIALYERLGFKTVSRRKGYYDNREDALVMSWQSAPTK